MKNTISDETFKNDIKGKLLKWIGELFRGSIPLGFPDLQILEIAEYPVRRLVLKAEAQTRTLTGFSKPGAAVARNTLSTEQGPAIDAWSIDAGNVDGFVNDKKIIDVPASLKSVPCRSCGGAGKLACPECQGQKTVYCAACHGDGYIVCPKCRRTLKIHCQACEGRGKVFSNSQQTYVDCAQCDGKGSFPCKDCENGRNPCADCKGQGRNPCHKCAQTGSLECHTCQGKGNIVSGFSVEITSFPVEERIDLSNADIPENITRDEFPAVSYAVERTIDTEARPITEPEALLKQIETLQKKIALSPEVKIIKQEAFIESKSFYKLRYRLGDKDSEVWLITVGDKLIAEKAFSFEIYSRIIEILKIKLKNGETSGARQIIKSIENIPALKNETENVKKELDKGILPSYITGGAAGAVVSCAGIFIFERLAWKASLSLPSVLFFSIVFIAAISAAGAGALFTAGLPFINSKNKRIAAGAVPPLAVSVMFLCFAAALGLNPARSLDSKQMLKEYNAYFPFGLRTLIAREDVEFLEKLVEKYSPAGVDLAAQNKDLEWMKNKLKGDETAVKKLEQTARDIEQISETRKKQQKKTYKRRSRLYLK